MNETTRLNFIEERDGKEAALQFAQITLRTYKKAVLQSRKRGFDKPHHASLPEYRRSFIESIIVLRQYTRG